MKKLDNSPSETQIKKMRKDNLTLLILAIFFSILYVAFSVYLIILEEPRELGFGLLMCWPISIIFGAILPIKENVKRIKDLESKQYNQNKYRDNK